MDLQVNGKKGDALNLGMEAAGLDYSEEYEWIRTYLYRGIQHEVMPKEQALSDKGCDVQNLIAITDYIDFKSLGYAGDPIPVGGRFKQLPLLLGNSNN